MISGGGDLRHMQDANVNASGCLVHICNVYGTTSAPQSTQRMSNHTDGATAKLTATRGEESV